MVSSAYEQNLPVLLEVLDDGDNVLYSHSMASVKFRQGSKTTVSGPLFDASASGSIAASAAWGEPIDGGW